VKYNLAAIRDLIQSGLTKEEFDDLVYDYFRSVYNQFTDGMTTNNKVRRLLEYAERHREIEQLLREVEKISPQIFGEYKNKIYEQPESNGTDNNDPGSEVEKCDVLILAANPNSTPRLQLEEEAQLIRERLQEGEIGKRYIVRAESAASIEDLSRYLLEYEPIILHFSGHGNSDGEIILNNRQGQAQPLSLQSLADLISIIQGRIECVVFNACFSLEKADAVADLVHCVIGMDQEFDDESALRFAGGFYRGLGFGRGYYGAFELGRNEIELLQLPHSKVPHFITRDTSLLQLETVKPRVTRTALKKTTEEVIESAKATVYPLWFGTNRKLVDRQDISKGFSGEADDRLHYGSCEVAVPKSHKIGSTGSPWWQRLLTLTDDRLRLQHESLRVLDKAQFWTGINQALQEHEPDERSALVFIHGFNVSFEAAALRAAQIGFDLQVPGIMAFYSWPSKGKLTSYAVDGETIQASEQYITEFLLNLARNSEIDKIHIIAHSMGNRGLLRVMQRISAQVQTEGEVSFGQIFLAAPDVNPELFSDLADAYHQLAERTTLYISSKDKALATSGIIHDTPRLGFFPPITIVEGIDTVQVSNIDLTLLGHGYFADSRILLEDIYDLLTRNTPPDNRRIRLQPAPGGENYWIMRK